MKKIWVKYKDVFTLCNRYNCTRMTVNNALNYRTNSIKARQIRCYALNFLNGNII